MVQTVEYAVEAQNRLHCIGSCSIYQNNLDIPVIVTNQDVKKHPYPQYEAKFKGGTVIYFNKDVGMIWSIAKNQTSLLPIIANDIIYLIKSKNPNVYIEIDGNDLLVNNEKVCGSTSTEKDNYIYEGLFVSINADKNIIEQIVTKPIEKIPGKLSEYNIEADEILNIFENVKNKYNLKEV